MTDIISRADVVARIGQIISYRVKLARQARTMGNDKEVEYLEGSCFPFQLLKREIETGIPCDLLAPKVKKARKRAV